MHEIHDNPLTLNFYFFYIIIGVVLTGTLGSLLYIQGGRFLEDFFQKDESFARRTNTLLLINFILINFGYVFLTTAPGVEIINNQHLIEKLVWRVGIFILILGIELFITLVGLYAIRQRRKRGAPEDATDVLRLNNPS